MACRLQAQRSNSQFVADAATRHGTCVMPRASGLRLAQGLQCAPEEVEGQLAGLGAGVQLALLHVAQLLHQRHLCRRQSSFAIIYTYL